MKVGTAQSKMNGVKKLIHEHATISAIVKHMTQDFTEKGPFKPDVERYFENLKKRRITIEETLDKIFNAELKESLIVNQDLIDFRYKLIEYYCRTNVSKDTNKAYEDILILFNNHFGIKGYELG